LSRASATIQPSSGRAAGGVQRGALPKVVSLEFDPDNRSAASRHDPDLSFAETVRSRLRACYESAVHGAAIKLGPSISACRESPNLVRRLVDDRMLVPSEEHRVPLRRIADETGSSYNRTLNVERRMRAHVRQTLQSDPEFTQLLWQARNSIAGLDQEIDDRLAGVLKSERSKGCAGLIASAEPEARAQMLIELMESAGEGVVQWIERLVERCPEETVLNFCKRWSIVGTVRRVDGR